MLYREFQTHPQLTPYVQLVWMMESESDTDSTPKQQIMPDGIVELVFHYADPWKTHVAGEQPFVQPKSFAISQMRKYIAIESNGRTGFIAVRFYPWGAYHFFREPIRDFLDNTISTEKLWPEHYDDLVERVHNAKDHEALSATIQQFLLDRLADYKKPDTRLDKAIMLIRQSRGLLSIHEICEETGFSKKQLQRKFVATLGTTPKRYARISRFLNICHHLEDYQNKTLTQLTYECGYYDQAHFIKEFTEFSGLTPKEFCARQDVFFADL